MEEYEENSELTDITKNKGRYIIMEYAGYIKGLVSDFLYKRNANIANIRPGF